MALVIVASGTVTVTASTETNLEAARQSGLVSYVYVVDLGALVSGEVAFVRVYAVQQGGTERLAYAASFIAGSDADPECYSVPVPMDGVTSSNIRASVQIKNWATNRAIPWTLFSL